jgi:hypothetical protein
MILNAFSRHSINTMKHTMQGQCLAVCTTDKPKPTPQANLCSITRFTSTRKPKMNQRYRQLLDTRQQHAT